MKTRNIIFAALVAAVVIAMTGYTKLFAESKSAMAINSGPKIAVVSVRGVFQNSKKNSEYKAKMTAEQDGIISQLEKLSKEIDAIQADLKTRKVGTDEYLKLAKEIAEKEASLDGQKKYYQQQFQVKDQVWTEKLYVQVLAKVALIAKQKGFDLVLEKDDIELPAQTATELMLIIRTHKVLFYDEKMDITSDVLAAIDADTSNKPIDANALNIKFK
jgi:Skp family chaperone for outer membrane proteins